MLESVLITLQSWHLIWGTSAKDCFCTAHAPLTVTHPFYFMFSTFLIITVLLRSIRPEVFYEKSALRNFAKFTGKHLCQSLFFNKVARLRTATLLKKRLRHRCLPVNFVIFLKTPFFKEHLWWLLLFTFLLAKRQKTWFLSAKL